MPGTTHDVLIIGSGFAGAATAYHLSRGGFRGKVTLLEREKIPGAHASGRNASLLLQSVPDGAIRRAAAASRGAYGEHRREVGFEEVGSLLLGRRQDLDLRREEALVPSRVLSPAEAVTRVPLLRGLDFEAGLLTPGDGVIDVWALLNFYLGRARAGGVEVVLDAGVEAVAAIAGGFRVTTSRGVWECGCLVNGAGAWAGEVASWVGVEAPSLVPFKRHLFVLDGVPTAETDAPFAWSLEPELYFRPESGGLLFSVCDEEARPSGPYLETVSPGIEERLAELACAHLPCFAEARIRSVWSCFRTKTSDGRFVVGRDPELPSFVWVAGLGGHGMGCSWEVGRLAAAAVRGESPPELAAFDPARFAAVRT